jgi:hypothetical protein
MKIHERMKAIEELQKIQLPWSVNRTGIRMSLFGQNVCFADDGDFLTLDEAREVIQQLVEEFGGTVKWGKK